MRITVTIEHDDDPDSVFAMLADPGFQELKCERSGSHESEVVVDVEQDATTIVTRRQMSTRGFPDFVKGFVGEWVHVVETQRWGPSDDTGLRTAAVTVEIPRTPVRFEGGITLTPIASGTEHVVDGDLHASVPIVGRKIEQSVSKVVIRAIQLEGELSHEWRNPS